MNFLVSYDCRKRGKYSNARQTGSVKVVRVEIYSIDMRKQDGTLLRSGIANSDNLKMVNKKAY